MSTLKSHEKVVFEQIFNRDGYVLDFNEQRFFEFFRENNVDINSQKYQFNGTSKMKRLRAFWEVEYDALVGKVLCALLQYAEVIGEVKDSDKHIAQSTINRLLGKNKHQSSPVTSEEDFLRKEFLGLDLNRLNVDEQLSLILKQRIKEIEKTIKVGAALATIFLCGSTLEGLLQDQASKSPIKFNKSSAAPKKDGLQNFSPDKHTAEICWKVLQNAITDLSGLR